MYWNIFCDVVHVQYTNQNIKIATKKTCKITCVRLCFGKGIWAEKNVFVSGPITRMLRPLCPGCKFQVDETEKKKKKKEKKSTKRLTAVAPYRNNEAGNGHQVHPVSFRSDKTPVYFVLFATSVRLEAR